MDIKVSEPIVDAVPKEGHFSSLVSSLTHNPLTTPIRDVYNAFQDRRAALGLSNPGTVEGVAREVQRDVFLNNFMFTGMRADLTKALSVQPLFQTAHNLTMGSEGMPAYSFAALYGSSKAFLQGNIDNEYSLSARANYRFTSAFVGKSQLSIMPGSQGGKAMLQLEADYHGDDFSANIKAANPSLLEGGLTGMVAGSYMQSITPGLSLGLESIWQRVSLDQGPETLIQYHARYKANDWIASASVLAQGGLQATYWRRLAERVEAGVDMNLQFLGLSGAASANPMMAGMMKNEGVATIGAKYDFRTSIFRGQIDSTGKVSALLEKRIAPPVQITFAGEMDHSKNSVKMGVAISVEAAGEEYAEKQEMLARQDPGPPPPF